ncbi:MAG: hypothetical protein AAB776_00305 [Patescibacteria group bacterium]
MKCPECEYDMGVVATKTSRGTTGKYYDWTQFHCKRDDVWAEIEIPKEEK